MQNIFAFDFVFFLLSLNCNMRYYLSFRWVNEKVGDNFPGPINDVVSANSSIRGNTFELSGFVGHLLYSESSAFTDS